MSQSDKVAIQKLMADLYSQPQQQVPPGNPIADHYQKRADSYGAMGDVAGVGTGVIGGLTLLELMEGNPLAVIMGGLGMGSTATMGSAADQKGKQSQSTSDMWANRFGANDGRQGMPGTPSGPAYRRQK